MMDWQTDAQLSAHLPRLLIVERAEETGYKVSKGVFMYVMCDGGGQHNETGRDISKS